MPALKQTSLRVILVASAVSLNLIPLWHPKNNPPSNPAFVIREAASPPAVSSAPDFKGELIDPTEATKSVHVASICELPGGRLATVWYGGTREGHADVALYFSIRSAGEGAHWSPPQTVVTRASAQKELQRYVRKVGNAVVFADAKGGIWLVYVSVAAGGWSGSSLNLKRSFDDGRTWTPSQRLTLSPLFNISELVKNQPAALTNGSWAVPIYHEVMGKFPEMLWLREDAGKVTATKSRLFGGKTAFQPALIPLKTDEALALCRQADGSSVIMLSRSTDAGKQWSPPQSIGLPNPDAGIDALRLFDGRLLLAFNDSKKSRDNLSLAIS
ncbi:MAG: exo-alpha-sialidase, partial [Verrucomicrobia bacterium]|nr:exo-alpha-sialidase [Verrucomicrobiota bacterium]